MDPPLQHNRNLVHMKNDSSDVSNPKPSSRDENPAWYTGRVPCGWLVLKQGWKQGDDALSRGARLELL